MRAQRRQHIRPLHATRQIVQNINQTRGDEAKDEGLCPHIRPSSTNHHFSKSPREAHVRQNPHLNKHTQHKGRNRPWDTCIDLSKKGEGAFLVTVANIEINDEHD